MSYRNYVPIKEGNSVIFYLNTSGFPLMSEVWDQMWNYAKELQPSASEKMNSIKENKAKINEIEYPIPPYNYLYNKNLTNSEKVEKIQNYIDKLQYNHTGLQFFEIRKDRPLMGLADLSKKIIEESLPIKCLEAVILSVYFINEITYVSQISALEKFTIGFKTNSKGNVHRHVVLGVYCHSTGLFGALGLSRRSDLGYKSLKFKTLTELIENYIECYLTYLHKVKRIKIGLPIPNSNRSFESIPWNGCTMNINKQDENEWTKLAEKHSRSIRHYNSTFSTKQFVGAGAPKIMASSSIKIKNKTYLDKHLNEINQKKSQSRSKSLEQKDRNGIQVQEDLEDENDYFDLENSKTDELNKENLTYLSKTAPIINESLLKSRKSSLSTTTLSFMSDYKKNENIESYSAGLVKRKQSSLRI